MRFVQTRTTPMQLAADLLLAGGLDVFVAERRAAGRSWRLIAQDLADATDRKVNVTHETLRAWFPEISGRVAS